ncbi:hypothetical protein FCOIX_10409 [Fusarium coicis]|nr:hypothetical protein FCOIX_10409 [Fusarium coicis]
MKYLLTLALAIPAIMATPAPAPDKTASTQVQACACVNGEGKTTVSGYCQYIRGRAERVDGGELCYPSDKYSDYMPEYFTADFCKGYYPGYNNRICQTKTATVELLRQHVSAQSTPVSDQLATCLSPRPLGASPAGSIHPDVQSSADLVYLLRGQPEGFALQVLESLRQGRSAKAIMESIGGNLSTNVNPSILAAVRGAMTPTHTPLEFQLIVQHPKFYPPLDPVTAASLDLGLLGIQPLDTDMTPDTQLSTLLYGDALSTVPDRIVQPQDMIGKTALSLDYGIPIDPRLDHVEISRFTNVPISNQLAAELNLFSMQNNFCSRMLVNALLAWTTADSRGRDIFDEYDVDYSRQRQNGVCKRMAQRMGLYGELDSASNHQLDLSNERVEAAVCATAWGPFNFQMVTSMSYHQEPIPKRTPRFRIPGKTLIAGQNGMPSTDATYTAVCQFWLIVFDMNYVYYFERSISMPSAVVIFQRLLGWADALPPGVQRHESNPDLVLNIYIWFHTAIVDLFRPFEHELPHPKPPAFAGVNVTPKAVISVSIEKLKRLIYQHRANCESSKYSIIWQSGMLYLVNHILRDLSSKESQFYFLLCTRGYQHLARYMPFVSGIIQSLIVMTKRQGVPLTSNTQRLLEEVRSESRRSREFFSAYSVDLEMVSKDPTSATLEKLTSHFRQESSGVGQGEASDSGSLPDGWKGSAQDLKATLSMLKDD